MELAIRGAWNNKPREQSIIIALNRGCCLNRLILKPSCRVTSILGQERFYGALEV